MQRCSIFIFLLFFTVACSPSEKQKSHLTSSGLEKPSGLPKKDEMKAVLKDVHKVEAVESLSNVRKPDSIKASEQKAMFLKVLEKHNISEEGFLKYIEYYQIERTQVLYEIYEELEIEFSEELGLEK